MPNFAGAGRAAVKVIPKVMGPVGWAITAAQVGKWVYDRRQEKANYDGPTYSGPVDNSYNPSGNRPTNATDLF